MKIMKTFTWFATLVLTVTLIGAFPVSAAPEKGSIPPAFKFQSGKFSTPAAFDVSPALSQLASIKHPVKPIKGIKDVRPDRGYAGQDTGYSGDAAVSGGAALTISAPLANFEGLSNQDNFNIFGGRVNPPDPNGEVGPNHYIEMVNLVFAVYSKTGTRLLGPVDTGTLWAGFAVADCTDPSGDPIVIYDQFADRWILTQFTP